MAWTDPRDWTAGETVTEAIMDAHIKANLDWLYDNLPIRATLWHEDSINTVGNAITTTIDASQAYNHYAYQNASADGDTFTQSFVLGPGTYTFYALGRTFTSMGMIDWDIDGTTIATAQDWYSAVSTTNVQKTVAAVVIGATDGGRHVLTGTVNGKNASSSAYNIRLTKLWFKQATDS